MNRQLFDSVKARLEPDADVMKSLRKRITEPNATVYVPESYSSPKRKAAAVAAAILPVMLVGGVLAVISQREIPKDRMPVTEQSAHDDSSSLSAVFNNGKKYAVSDIYVDDEYGSWTITDPDVRIAINSAVKSILESSQGAEISDEITAVSSFSYTYDQQEFEVRLVGGQSCKLVINGKIYDVDRLTWYQILYRTTGMSSVSVSVDEDNKSVMSFEIDNSDVPAILSEIENGEVVEPDILDPTKGRSCYISFTERGRSRNAVVWFESEYISIEQFCYKPDKALLDELKNIIETEIKATHTDVIDLQKDISDISVKYRDEDFTITDKDAKLTVYDLLTSARKCETEEVTYTGGCKRLSFKAGDEQFNVQFCEDGEHIRINGVSYSAMLCYTQLWETTEEMSDISVFDVNEDSTNERIICNEQIKKRLSEIVDSISEGETSGERNAPYTVMRDVQYYKCGELMIIEIPDGGSGVVEIGENTYTPDSALFDELIALTDEIPHMSYSIPYDPDAPANSAFFKEHDGRGLSASVTDELMEKVGKITDSSEGYYILGYGSVDDKDTVTLKLSKITYTIVFTGDSEYPIMIDGLLFHADEKTVDELRTEIKNNLAITITT